MKNAKQLVSLLALVLFSLGAYAGDNPKTVKISTSAQCGMCKTTIESAVNDLDGVKSVALNLETKALTVSYNSDELSADDIRNAVAKSGYDADDVKAVKKAYKDLPNCCKKSKSYSGGGC